MESKYLNKSYEELLDIKRKFQRVYEDTIFKL